MSHFLEVQKFNVAINKSIVNKADVDDKEQLKILNGGFENFKLTLLELKEQINAGHPFCAQHKNWRKSANFISNQILAVDIDTGMNLQEALDDPYIQKFAAIIYTTPSHTEDNQRFRIVFALDAAITDREKMRYANQGVIKRFGGDESCKDACRLFYGSMGSFPKFIGNTLPNSELEKLIELGREGPLIYDKAISNTPITNRSNIKLKPDELIRMENGKSSRLQEIEGSTVAYCPVHIDNNPSAFIVKSKANINGVYCSRCCKTYWPESENKNVKHNFDFYVIEDIITNHERDELIENARDEFIQNKNDYLYGNSTIELFGNDFQDRCSFTYSTKYLPEIYIENGVTFIRSPKGTGKTESLLPVINRLKKEGKSILLVGHRQILLQSMSKRLGLTCYFYTSGKRIKNNTPTKNYAISIDSISRLLKPETNKYDVIIIDESEQVFSHLTSSTLQARRRECYMTLFEYLKKSQYAIAADADLGQLTIEAMCQSMGTGRTYQFYLNTYKADQCDFQIFGSEAQLVQDMIDTITKGGRHYIATNSLTKAKELKQAIVEKVKSKLRIMMVTSEVSGTEIVQHFIDNIKTEILNYDVVIASPSLGTGVDISFNNDVLDIDTGIFNYDDIASLQINTGINIADKTNSKHIDTVFGFFVARVNTHFDIDQQLSRVRRPKEIKVWISPEEFNFETEPEVIMRETLKNSVLNDTLIGYDEITSKPIRDETYLKVYSHVQSISRASKNCLRKNLINLRERNGFRIVRVMPDIVKIELGSEAKAMAKEIVEKIRAEDISRAVKIDNERFEELTSNSHQPSNADQDEIDRYRIESYYREEITPELIALDAKGAYRLKIELLSIYLSDTEVLIELDRLNADKIISDKKKRVLKQSVIKELITSAELADLYEPVKHQTLITANQLNKFIIVCRDKRLQLQELFNLSLRNDLEAKPMAQLGQVLQMIGLSLEKVQTQKRDGQKIRFYKINQESWNTAKGYAQTRMKIQQLRKTEM